MRPLLQYAWALPSALNKNKIGLKKIPPPIPTTPEINPKIPPIKIENIIGEFFYNLIFYHS